MREDALRVTEVRDIALTWLEEAIKAGIYEAYAAVGDLYSEHFTAGSTPRDDQEAFSWYMKGAMRGDALCLFRVAVCFAEGYGTKPDIPRALRLYRQAADAGSALACRQLGEMYAAGIHVHREIRRALTWFLRAYELGDQEEKRAAAIGMLRVVQAYIDTPRYKEVEELLHSFLEKLYAAGDTSCLFALADIERRRGRMDLYLKDLEIGMQAGHDSCRERLVQYYMNEVVTELRVLEPIFDELAERRGERSSSMIILRIRGMRLLAARRRQRRAARRPGRSLRISISTMARISGREMRIFWRLRRMEEMHGSWIWISFCGRTLQVPPERSRESFITRIL